MTSISQGERTGRRTLTDVLVVGAGPAGMSAALHAARGGARVTLIDKNEKTGKKLYITGKGRCNLTNACDMSEFPSHIFRNPRFAYSAFACMSNADLMELVQGEGVPLKTERGERVFPQSDRSSDVIRALNSALSKAGVRVLLNTRCAGIDISGGRVKGVFLADGSQIACRSVIVATGGVSYPSTGSTGDGYAWANEAGHSVSDRVPSLVPIETKQSWPAELMGLTLKNVRLSAYFGGGKKPFFSEQGEMLFTHFGVSGPLVLKASGTIPEKALAFEGGRYALRDVSLSIDLKCAMTDEMLDERLIREAGQLQRSRMASFMDRLEPHSLGLVILRLCGIDPHRSVDSLLAQERRSIGKTLKGLPLTAKALRGMDEAIVTRGGVDARQIDPKTMESRLVKGLYFAGEVIDVDAATGGFNLQIAFSTGALAGKSAAAGIAAPY